MIASKHPLLYLVMIIGIIAAVITVVIVTKNPLAILGLMFIPAIPVMAPQPAQDDDEEIDDADGRGIGFTAEV